ncbi:MAG: hypothetical protein ACTTIZ_08385 [Treponema sp.]
MTNTYGNFSIGQITKMKVDLLGRDLFCDINYCDSEKDLSWSNFIDKIYNGEDVNLENTHKFNKRTNDIILKILKNTITENSDEKKEITQFAGFIILFFLNFFSKLSKAINDIFPGNFTQKELFQYIFYLHIREETGPKCRMGKFVPGYRIQKSIPIIVKKIFQKFYLKDSNGYYRLSIEKSNDFIRKNCKEKNITLDKIKNVLDTKRRNSLKNPSTTWNVLLQMLTNKEIFNGLSDEIRKQYVDDYLSYYFLKHFEMILKNYVSVAEMTELIDTVLRSTKYRILSVDFSNKSLANTIYKIPSTKAEYAIYGDMYSWYEKVDTEFFYYDRSSSNEIEATLDYKKNYEYSNLIVSRISKIISNTHGGNFLTSKIDEGKERFFLEKICSEKYIGLCNNFYYNWYKGAIEFSLFKYSDSLLENSISSFTIAFEKFRYFAGLKLKEFCEMYMFILLEDWKITKKSGKIRDLYQFASSQNMVLQVYQAFKHSKFEDPFINPWEILIRLWNSGMDVLELSMTFGFEKEEIQHLLRENEKYLTRKDDDMYRYIPQWEEDEMYLDDGYL